MITFYLLTDDVCRDDVLIDVYFYAFMMLTMTRPPAIRLPATIYYFIITFSPSFRLPLFIISFIISLRALFLLIFHYRLMPLRCALMLFLPTI